MPEDTPIACSLSAGELSNRLAEARALGRASLVSRGKDGTLRFRGDPDTRARLEAIVAAESRCCPFLSFDLREEAGSFVLRIDAPEAALPIARDLADAFTTPAVQQALSRGGGRRR